MQHAQPGRLGHGHELISGVVAYVGRVAQSLRPMHPLVDPQGVLYHHEPTRDAGHLGDRPRRVGEVMRGNAADDDVEGVCLERQSLGRADDVGPHAGGGVAGGDRTAELAQAARHVAPAGGHVECRNAGPGLAPGDDLVQVVTLSVRAAAEVVVEPAVPLVHAAMLPIPRIDLSTGWARASCVRPGRSPSYVDGVRRNL